MNAIPVLLGATVFMSVSLPPARASDIPGHMLVAQIAHDRLNPKAAATSQALAP